MNVIVCTSAAVHPNPTLLVTVATGGKWICDNFAKKWRYELRFCGCDATSRGRWSTLSLIKVVFAAETDTMTDNNL